MSAEKNKSSVQIIIAIIAFVGSIAVALISKPSNPIKPDQIKPDPSNPNYHIDTIPATIVDINAPKFNKLSTFCDTLKYFIDQNSKSYSWLKEGKGIKDSHGNLQFSSKIDLLGYPTIIEKFGQDYSATVDVLETFDGKEAFRIQDELMKKFVTCLGDFKQDVVGSTPRENIVSISMKFRKAEDIINISVITNKKPPDTFFVVQIYLER